MLESLTLSGIECFGRVPLELDQLRQATFIFGANGSGKTSISRALADSERAQWDAATWQGGRVGDVLVYNKDFATRVLESYSRLEGVFLLGDASQELHDELDELKSPEGKQTQAQRKQQGCKENLKAAQEALDTARSAFEAAVWREKSTMPARLEPAFHGYNSKKSKFATQLLEVHEANAGKADDEATLIREAESVFDTSAVPEKALALLPTLDAAKIPGQAMLATRIVGKADARLSDVVEMLENHDWVNQGRDYLAHSNDLCPFCQQKTPKKLSTDLEELFDHTYTTQKNQLESFVRSFKTVADEIITAAEALVATTNRFLDNDKLSAAIAELKQANTSAQVNLDKKLASPATTMTSPDLSSHINAVNEVLRIANTSIKEHNDRVQRRSAEHPQLVKRCWRYFVQTHAKADIAVYAAEKSRLDPRIKGLSRSLDTTDAALETIASRIQTLEGQMVSSAQVITRINRLLANTGFSSFELAPSSEVKDGYTMVREGGVVERGTLSEGESTFITFLYFYYLVENTRIDEPTRPLVVVIDDPISSMDSDVMLVISVLVKTLIERVKDSKSRLSQVFMLTHNVHFHKEVTYRRDPNADGKRLFYVIRKFPDAPHQLMLHERNPIQSAYGRLWQEVREASQNEGSHSPVGLENIMRRILETYFNILGDVGQEGVTSKFSGDDMLICRSLYLWAHGGSHSLFDDNDFSPSMYSTDMYLRVFREIFEKTDQIQHYRMMMQLPNSEDVAVP